MASVIDWIRLLRPNHWIKNLVVFSAPLFALAFDWETFARVFLIFVSFSMIASAFYIANDVRDRNADRTHPQKRFRPIAAGNVSARSAILMTPVLAGIGIWLGFYLGTDTGLVLLTYAGLQIAYNLGVKRIPILDVLVLGLGLVLRALAGAAAGAVMVSEWFILCIGLLGVFLGIEKRKSERINLGSESSSRSVLSAYSPALLQRMESVVTSGAVIAYALWTVEGNQSIWMMTTIPFVAFAIFRYQLITDQGGGERPEEVLIQDHGIALAFVLWLTLILLLFSLEATGGA